MREETKILVCYYGIDDGMDWMNFPIHNPHDLQFHHIKKKADGGKMVFNNGAILTPDAHKFLHTIERYDIEIYNAIKRMFRLYVAQRSAPSLEQRIIMQEIIEMFYLKYQNAKTKKGKPIIKECFKKAKSMV